MNRVRWLIIHLYSWLIRLYPASFREEFGAGLMFWTTESWVTDLTFIVLGLSIGFVQWLLLWWRLPKAGWWIVASVVGWGLFGLIIGGSFGQFGLIVLGFLPAWVTVVMLALLINQDLPPEPQGV